MPESEAHPLRVVVLGAGFGGLELTTRLSDELGDDVDGGHDTDAGDASGEKVVWPCAKCGVRSPGSS